MGNIRIVRRPEILDRTGYSRSTLQNRMNEGLFPPPISLGDRAVGWIESEANTVLCAMVAGQNNDKIRNLVICLVGQRTAAFHNATHPNMIAGEMGDDTDRMSASLIESVRGSAEKGNE
jgi:prophage regulatory protein